MIRRRNSLGYSKTRRNADNSFQLIGKSPEKLERLAADAITSYYTHELTINDTHYLRKLAHALKQSTLIAGKTNSSNDTITDLQKIIQDLNVSAIREGGGRRRRRTSKHIKGRK